MSAGVGFIGAGPAVQAIHLPTLARFGGEFHVARVMDIDAGIAEAVASRAGAAWTTSTDELLADPAVEVVAICSPSQFHAAQVTAAIEAGKRAILCEKPFAVSADEAAELAGISRASGVPIVVGAMHTFDPGWAAVRDRVAAMTGVHTVRSTVILPPNSAFEDLATEIHARVPFVRNPATDAAALAARVRGGILGLAIHDLPLVRAVAPTIGGIVSARPLAPFGYAIQYRSGDTTVEFVAVMHQQWKNEWTLDVWGADAAAHVEFTPSYVQAGSASARFADASGISLVPAVPRNGYEVEWRHLADLVGGATQDPHDLETEIDDLHYALSLADAVEAHILGGGA